MRTNTIPAHVQLLAWLLSLICTAAISFGATWALFDTLGAWRWL